MRPLSHPVTSADHALGPAAARLVVVEYGDYDCPHTRAAHANLKQLTEERGGDLRLVYRYFPLRHMHPLAQWLAERMELAHEQGLFWALHERLMGERRMLKPLAERLMQEGGLALEALPDRLSDLQRRVEGDVQKGLADGVHSTPSFFFNGRPHDGHYDLETMREQIRLTLGDAP